MTLNRRLKQWNRISRDLTIATVGVVTAIVAIGADDLQVRLAVVAIGTTAILTTWLLAKLQLRTWLWHQRRLIGFSSRHRNEVPGFLTRNPVTRGIVAELTVADDSDSEDTERDGM